jgi:phosphoserine phosphatase RsbU/P
MTDPKIFYRELDALLAKIRIEQAGAHFLKHILSELDQNFGRRLHFGQGRIYELSDRLFTLTHKNGLADRISYITELPMTATVIQLAYKNRSYIYDQPDLCKGFYAVPPTPAPAQAAFWVHSPERQWLFVFTLFDGWVREEINLFLNSVRTAMNYRLFSDAVGTRLERVVQIQKSLLPTEAPEIPGYQISGRSQPAEMVGGDFFDYYELEEGTFGVGLGDASGHGLPAALLIRDVVIGLRMGLSLEFRTIHTLRRLNKVIQRSTFASNFVSLFVGEFDANGHLFFVNAGHPAPILVHGHDVKELAATGITLGFMEEIQLGRDYVRMPTDSVLVIYSDGIIERMNNQGDMFGVERLRDFTLKYQSLDAQTLLELLFETVIEFGNGAAWEDDATLVVIKH